MKIDVDTTRVYKWLSQTKARIKAKRIGRKKIKTEM
jgi:hypothetical protein